MMQTLQQRQYSGLLTPIIESPQREARGDDEDPLLLEPVKASLDFTPLGIEAGGKYAATPQQGGGGEATFLGREELEMATITEPGRSPLSSAGDEEEARPGLIDDEHSDPCECLCNLIQMPRVPSARKNYLLHRHRNGRIYTVGPHWTGLCFTIVLVCVASSLFIRNVCLSLGFGYVLVAVVYSIMTLLTLLRVACTDPGFITKNAPESVRRRKYCPICQLYTAPTAGHCEDCGVCIEGLDHHCPWTGHCIGRQNMGAFLSFNCTWLTYVVFVLICLAIQADLFG